MPPQDVDRIKMVDNIQHHAPMINRKVLEIKLHCSQSGTHSCVDALTAILLPHIAVNTPLSKVFIAMLKHLVHVCVG